MSALLQIFKNNNYNNNSSSKGSHLQQLIKLNLLLLRNQHQIHTRNTSLLLLFILPFLTPSPNQASPGAIPMKRSSSTTKSEPYENTSKQPSRVHLLNPSLYTLYYCKNSTTCLPSATDSAYFQPTQTERLSPPLSMPSSPTLASS